jgi:hypothetical protein
MLALLAPVVAGHALVHAQATPGADDMVTNPAYAHWSAFKRGTTVTQKQTVILGNGRTLEHEIMVRLLEKTRDRAVIETTQRPNFNTMVESTRTITTFPARVKKSAVDTPRAELHGFTEGDEPLTVAGKTVSAHWVEAVTRTGDEVTTRKVWSAREIPGGVVKETIVRKRGDQVLSDSMLQVVAIKTP